MGEIRHTAGVQQIYGGGNAADPGAGAGGAEKRIDGAGSSAKLIDSAGRRVGYLRVSVTDRCNYRCRYCMPPHGVRLMAPGRILSYEQMIALIDLLLPLGIRKVRVTGGEPLVRKNIVRFFELLGERPISDLTLTTNGFHLAEMAADLVRCGVRRVNVSLDSLRPETYTRITGVDGLERVVRGIDEALDRGMQVKLNTVVMKDLNLDEVADLLQFGIRRFCDVRFIELMPHAYSGPDHSSIFVPSRQVLSRLQGRFDLIQVDGGPVTGGPSTSTQYQVGGTGAAVGLISSMSEPFCAGCDKIRITPDGSVKPCLFEPGVSLRRALDEYLAGGEPGVVLDEVFRALHAKPVLHRHAGEPGTHDLVMHRTGG